MRVLSNNAQQHLTGNVTTFAFCCQITRRDGIVLGFSGFDQTLIIDGIAFEPSHGFQHTAMEQRVDLEPDSIDIQAIIDDDRITADDLLNGVYDHAVIDAFLVDYTQEVLEKLPLSHGLIRGIEVTNDLFVAQIDGLNSQLKQAHLDLYTPSCRLKRLGDARCGVDLSTFTHNYTVDINVNERSFTAVEAAQTDDYFRYGIVTWDSGLNAGSESVVKQYQNGQFELVDMTPFAITNGDTFIAVRGCDRQFNTCRDVFDNVMNFRGEPSHLLPGLDKIRSPLGN